MASQGGFVLSFVVANDVQLERSFSRFADSIKDLRGAWMEIADDFRSGERQQFSSGGGFGSGGWASLAPATLSLKARHGYPADILVRTGELRRSLTQKGGQHVEDIQPLQLRIGTDVDYAIYHQKGTSRHPTRPPIQLPEEQKTRWHKAIHRYLVHAAKEAFE